MCFLNKSGGPLDIRSFKKEIENFKVKLTTKKKSNKMKVIFLYDFL